MLTQDQLDEINLLTQFNLESIQEGLKIHSSAQRTVVAAAERLFKKGMISQSDGGYLTHRGIHAAEHAHAMLTILSE